MKENPAFKKLTICIILAVCLLCCGCDGFSVQEVKAGVPFKLQMEYLDIYALPLNFSYENAPEVKINYETEDGKNKIAVFRLDAFDANMKIGFKLVQQADKSEWDAARFFGSNSAPDMKDFELIQKAALQYDFPVLFLNIYQYQNEYEMGKVLDNSAELVEQAKDLFATPEMVNWSENGMRYSTWVNEYIDQSLEMYGLEISHENLPIVEIEYGGYGRKQTTKFLLDGYDPRREVGYQFVTEEDASFWAEQRAQGDMMAPNLEDYADIKYAAMY